MNRRLPPPARLRPSPVPEIKTHLAVVDLLNRLCKPRDWMWSHIPLGGERDKRSAAIMKAMGTRPGIPDFWFLHRTGFTCFLELKTETGELGDSQRAFYLAIRNFENVRYEVARTFDDAVRILIAWGVLPNVQVAGARDQFGNAVMR